MVFSTNISTAPPPLLSILVEIREETEYTSHFFTPGHSALLGFLENVNQGKYFRCLKKWTFTHRFNHYFLRTWYSVLLFGKHYIVLFKSFLFSTFWKRKSRAPQQIGPICSGETNHVFSHLPWGWFAAASATRGPRETKQFLAGNKINYLYLLHIQYFTH